MARSVSFPFEYFVVGITEGKITRSPLSIFAWKTEFASVTERHARCFCLVTWEISSFFFFLSEKKKEKKKRKKKEKKKGKKEREREKEEEESPRCVVQRTQKLKFRRVLKAKSYQRLMLLFYGRSGPGCIIAIQALPAVWNPALLHSSFNFVLNVHRNYKAY